VRAHLIAADRSVSEVSHVPSPPPTYIYSSSAVWRKSERYKFVAIEDGIALYEHCPLTALPGR
jgi:hypothetical protein